LQYYDGQIFDNLFHFARVRETPGQRSADQPARENRGKPRRADACSDDTMSDGGNSKRISRPEHDSGFVLVAKRPVEERTFVWLGRSRRLS